jgi:hypothetical protein
MMIRFVLLGASVITMALGTAVVTGESSRPLVGQVMALLAVFEEADALPPETSPEANALIHALIQTQAALTKTTNQAAQKWFSEALRSAEDRGEGPVSREGLTSRTLEALLAYAATHRPAERPAVLAGLREFNIGQPDFDLMARVFGEARDRFRAKGRDLHRAFETQRRAMPFH